MRQFVQKLLLKYSHEFCRFFGLYHFNWPRKRNFCEISVFPCHMTGSAPKFKIFTKNNIIYQSLIFSLLWHNLNFRTFDDVIVTFKVIWGERSWCQIKYYNDFLPMNIVTMCLSGTIFNRLKFRVVRLISLISIDSLIPNSIGFYSGT